jgi:3-hydroxybutyryl-CoA dehydrogenase
MSLMTIVICTDKQKEQLIQQDGALGINAAILWTVTINNDMAAASCIDLLFDNTPERIGLLNKIAPLVIINSVAGTTAQLPPSFIRINAWPGFLNNSIIEASVQNENKEAVENIFSVFHKRICWTQDMPGFVSARIIAMIINEAYLTLQEEVSTKEEIDMAMKSGTNYPYGPFEWAAKIGIERVYELLCAMSTTNARYAPCQALTKEALLQ